MSIARQFHIMEEAKTKASSPTSVTTRNHPSAYPRYRDGYVTKREHDKIVTDLKAQIVILSAGKEPDRERAEYMREYRKRKTGKVI